MPPYIRYNISMNYGVYYEPRTTEMSIAPNNLFRIETFLDLKPQNQEMAGSLAVEDARLV